jgi:hypothetical protein
MSEAAILQRIRLDLGREPAVKIFRNNVGVLTDARGVPVHFGLHPGSGDLIGWRKVIITPEMVGQAVAVFLSIEVKTQFANPRPDQVQWAEVVREAGGLSGVARSPDQARVIARLTQ